MHVFGVICHKITTPLIYNIKKISRSSDAVVLILFDIKSTVKEFDQLQRMFRNQKNIVFMDRISIDWGQYSLVEGPLKMMKFAQGFGYKYFSLISGDDVAVMEMYDVINLLETSYQNKKEFIGYNPKSMGSANPYNRIIINYPNYFYNRNPSLFTKAWKRLVFNIQFLFNKKDISHIPTLYKGCNWFTISKEAVEYILSYLGANPKYAESFKTSLCSDEMFFQTILYNSPFRENIYGIDSEMKDCAMALRDIDWETGPEFPKVYHEEDFENIKSRGMLFARKIDSNIPISVLEKYFP